MNLSTYYRMRAREFGNNLVAIDGDRKTTYNQLEEYPIRLPLVEGNGIKRGKEVLFICPTVPNISISCMAP